MNLVAEQSEPQQSSVEGAAATEEFSQSVQEVASNVQETLRPRVTHRRK